MPCLRLAAPLVLALSLATAAAPALAEPAPASPSVSPGDQIPVVPADPELETFSPSLQPGDAFGEEVTLPERTIVYLSGRSDWKHAFDALARAFASLDGDLARQRIAPSGPHMTIYTRTDDEGFRFRAAVPVAQAPHPAPVNASSGTIAVGQAPSGKALKFVHRGTYDAMNETYEAIVNYLDEKGLEAKDVFLEEYPQGPLKQAGDQLKVDVFVPVK